MSNTHHDDVMNIIMEAINGDIDINEALSRIHEYVKEETPQHGPQTIIVVGTAITQYENERLEKQLIGNVILAVRPDGSVVVMPQDAGIKPIAYITEGAEVTTTMDEGLLHVHAQTKTEILTMKFLDIQYSSGLQ